MTGGLGSVVHEALARAWRRLRGWLDDDMDGQRTLRHLSTAADSWDALGRLDSELYRGVRLARALEWRDRAKPDLTEAEADFLATAERLDRSERDRAATEERRRRRATTRLRILLSAVAVLLVLAVAAGYGVALQARRAETAAIAADARRAASLSFDSPTPERALLLGVEAVRLVDSPDTRASLLAALSRAPGIARTTQVGEVAYSLAMSPDGRRVVVGGEESVSFLDAESLRPDASVEGGARVAYRNDGRQLAIGLQGGLRAGGLVLLDLESRRRTAVPLPGVPSTRLGTLDLHYSRQGNRLAAVVYYREDDDWGNSIFVWDAEDVQRPIRSIESAPIWAASLDPSGRRLYMGTVGRMDSRVSSCTTSQPAGHCGPTTPSTGPTRGQKGRTRAMSSR